MTASPTIRAAATEARYRAVQDAHDRYRIARREAHEAWPTESRDCDAASFRADLLAIAAAQRDIACRHARRAFDLSISNAQGADQEHSA